MRPGSGEALRCRRHLPPPRFSPLRQVPSACLLSSWLADLHVPTDTLSNLLASLPAPCGLPTVLRGPDKTFLHECLPLVLSPSLLFLLFTPLRSLPQNQSGLEHPLAYPPCRSLPGSLQNHLSDRKAELSGSFSLGQAATTASWASVAPEDESHSGGLSVS